jgi:hypothetical protein
VSHGQLMIGPRSSSLMSQGFVWNSQTDRQTRAWRSPNKRLAPACIAEHDRFGGGFSHGVGGNKCLEENGPTYH